MKNRFVPTRGASPQLIKAAATKPDTHSKMIRTDAGAVQTDAPFDTTPFFTISPPSTSGRTHHLAGLLSARYGSTLALFATASNYKAAFELTDLTIILGIPSLFATWLSSSLAGSSLVPDHMSHLRKLVIAHSRNVRYFSSYGMSVDTLSDYVHELNKFKPAYMRGYASSLHALACFVRDRSLSLAFRPKAVFTTAERLLEGQRSTIEESFGAPVFNNYGLNDGGVSAYECQEHAGLHIDMERAILEVVDDQGRQIFGQPGRILATSLHNTVFPFIRYETGDLGVMAPSSCACGRQMPLLTELMGRTTDVLEVNGRSVGSPVLTVLMGKLDVEQYQIVQTPGDSLVFRIVRVRDMARLTRPLSGGPWSVTWENWTLGLSMPFIEPEVRRAQVHHTRDHPVVDRGTTRREGMPWSMLGRPTGRSSSCALSRYVWPQ